MRASVRNRSFLGALPLVLLGVLLAPVAPGLAAGDLLDSGPRVDGAWVGDIVYAPGEVEFGVRLDIAPGVEGDLAGTVDIATQRMKFYPLTYVRAEGSKIEAMFTKWTENADGEGYFDAEFIFRGNVVDDGRAIEGEFKGWMVRGNDRVPFRLERIGEAGDPEPEVPPAAIADLSESSSELAEAFNEAAGATRVVILLSPT